MELVAQGRVFSRTPLRPVDNLENILMLKP